MKEGFDIFGKEYSVMFKNDLHHRNSVDYQIYEHMILIDSESEDFLYNHGFSSFDIDLKNHELYKFAQKFMGDSDIETLQNILDFTSLTVRNFNVQFENMKFGGTEKEIIERGTDWCTDISRIGLAILQCLNIPCRLAILVNSKKAYNGHTLCEAYLDNEYMIVDFTYGVLGLLSKKYSVKDLLKQPEMVKDIYSSKMNSHIDLEYIEGLYDMAAIAEYDITKKHDYSISEPNEYYLNMMNLSHDGLWKMGEDMKIDDLIIRKATVEDAEGKGYVHYQSWIETYTGLFPDEVMARLSLEKNIQLAKDYPENTYVAIVENKIVGFSCYLESRDEDLENTGEIMAIYILKEYQGLGIGKKLMEVCYKELSNYSKLSLWVLGCNKKSVSFYERQGFIADGKTKRLHEKEVIRMIKRMLGDVMFSFFEFNNLADGEIRLVIDKLIPENKDKGFVPAYKFNIVEVHSNKTVGFIDIRIGHSKGLYYGGNIGYTVFEEFRGNNYALKACKLIKDVAITHGMEYMYITCNPDNIPSRRTCEKLGLPLQKIIDLPEDNDMYKEGERQKCIYYWDLQNN